MCDSIGTFKAGSLAAATPQATIALAVVVVVVEGAPALSSAPDAKAKVSRVAAAAISVAIVES